VCRPTIHELVLRSVKTLFQGEFAAVEFAGRLKKTAVVRKQADIGTWSHCSVPLDTCAIWQVHSVMSACPFCRIALVLDRNNLVICGVEMLGISVVM
jgi:hypothetical protein